MKEKFIDIYRTHVTREGANELLDYLCSDKSDFFTAPASTIYHGNHEGGLVEHSINVYECLADYLSRPRVKELYGGNYTAETIAVCGLLHDVCKIGCYKTSMRNVKDENGRWIQKPYYTFDDDMPYGHGEKSVYIVNGFMRLSREEAFAIRYHMGFANVQDTRNITKAFKMYPLALALYTADMEAAYYLEE
ncbi:MAG: hydrolase [Oscillospiraceae bacterium]|nr:hydrolase [Oscillospiraceae bacterium]